MDISETIKKILRDELDMGSAAREIIQPVIDHMDAGVVRPVSEEELVAIASLVTGDGQ